MSVPGLSGGIPMGSEGAYLQMRGGWVRQGEMDSDGSEKREEWRYVRFMRILPQFNCTLLKLHCWLIIVLQLVIMPNFFSLDY